MLQFRYTYTMYGQILSGVHLGKSLGGQKHVGRRSGGAGRGRVYSEQYSILKG